MGIPAIEERPFDSAADFLAAMRRSNDAWWARGECPWIFRGHYDGDNWQLLPSAFRDDPSNKLRPLIQMIERWAEPQRNERDPNSRNWRALIQANAESEALHQFGVLANELGFNLRPVPPSPLKEGVLFQHAQEDAFPIPLGLNTDHLSPPLHLAPSAQHHRIPTRLLDFTYDPVAAAYFAASHSFRRAGPPPQVLAVWAYNTRVPPYVCYSSASTQVIGYSEGLLPDDYVDAQSGCFLRMRSAGRYFVEDGNWPALDVILQGRDDIEGDLPVLRKLTLPVGEADTLLSMLERERLSLARIMPTLDNVAETIMNSWERAG